MRVFPNTGTSSTKSRGGSMLSLNPSSPCARIPKDNTETEWMDKDGEEWFSDTHERFSKVCRLAQV